MIFNSKLSALTLLRMRIIRLLVGYNATTASLLRQLGATEGGGLVLLLAGWCGLHGGERRTDALHLHDCIVPYGTLSDAERQKDRNVIAFAQTLVQS